MKHPADIITVTPDASINDALQKMQINFIKHMVIEFEKKPVGIITERDISKFLESDKNVNVHEIPIRQIMKKNPVTVTDGKTCFTLASVRIDSLKIGSVILIDSNDNVTGIITKTDIAKAYSIVFGGKFKVKEYMNHKVFTCRKSDSLEFALDMINQNNVSRLVVTTNDGVPVSVITTNTILNHRTQIQNADNPSQINSKKICVGDLVKNEIVAINSEDDLSIAAKKMIDNHISGIPIVNATGKLIGIISNFDVVRAFVRVSLNDDLLEQYAESY